MLVGIAEIAVALAGFIGVVVAFGSRSEGAWHRITTTLFWALIITQIMNAVLLRALSPFLAALICNLAGVAMQFSRLIRSAFHN